MVFVTEMRSVFLEMGYMSSRTRIAVYNWIRMRVAHVGSESAEPAMTSLDNLFSLFRGNFCCVLWENILVVREVTNFTGILEHVITYCALTG